MVIKDKEYDKLIQRLVFFDTMRNNLLTFSFTSVLAILGVSLALEMNSTNVWICLFPFFLIIPFTARISYYRLASAHIGSFLKEFAKENMQFEIGTRFVPENGCKRYPQIAWLVNHEMVMLSAATSCTFYVKYVGAMTSWTYYNYIGYIGFVIPIVLTVFVYLLSDSTYIYDNLMKVFEERWGLYHKNRQ